MSNNFETINVYQSDSKTCTYLPDRASRSLFFTLNHLESSDYERLLAQNWRRSGTIIYKPQCESCALCMQLRIDVHTFLESKSQRLCLRRNQDVEVDISPDIGADDAIELYCKYQVEWHGAENPPDGTDVRDFLASSPVNTMLMRYRIDNRLVGAGWVDLLDNGLSSVYFAFDTREAQRRLGVFSLLREIKLCKELGKQWLYLGYWIPGSKTMDYKAQYLPHEVLVNGIWEKRSTKLPLAP